MYRSAVAAFAAIIAVTLCAKASSVSLVGASTKVCQLTGETDWASNTPTAARTFTSAGLDGTDVGYPVETGSRLYFLFGDTWPIAPAAFPALPPDDALGWTTRTAPPGRGCLDLQIALGRNGKFAHPTVSPQIKQGLFNVPSGGIALGDIFYAFFWTDHCARPTNLAPDAVAPLTRPAPSSTCVEIDELNSVGRSVLARTTVGHPLSFQRSSGLTLRLQTMPSGFVVVSAANPPAAPMMKQPRIPVLGLPRYRASVPYLAMAPRTGFGDPSTWMFYAGSSGGAPNWVDRATWESGHTAAGAWTPPAGAEIYDPGSTGERCIGEHHLTWNEPLNAWLLTYNCGGKIEARSAPQPWGPWSAPIVLLSAAHDPDVVCTLIMNLDGCPGLTRRNYWPLLANGKTMPGGFYGPFVLNRYTRPDEKAARRPQAVVYWLVSTWNPYNVVVMRSTLAMTE